MELIKRDKRDGYIYDCIIKGYDTTFWKATVGVPAVSTNYLRFTSAAGSSYLLHIFADVEFSLNIPTTPSVGEAKVWGLRNPSGDTLGAVYFEISGSTFRVRSVDDGGNVESTDIAWVSGWENAQTKYRIIWEQDLVRFMINGTIVATHTTRVPANALSLRISNGDADNVDLGYVAVRRAAAII